MAKIHHYKAHAEVKQTSHLNLSTLRRLSIKILQERSLSKIQSVFFFLDPCGKACQISAFKIYLKEKDACI